MRTRVCFADGHTWAGRGDAEACLTLPACRAHRVHRSHEYVAQRQSQAEADAEEGQQSGARDAPGPQGERTPSWGRYILLSHRPRRAGAEGRWLSAFGWSLERVHDVNLIAWQPVQYAQGCVGAQTTHPNQTTQSRPQNVIAGGPCTGLLFAIEPDRPRPYPSNPTEWRSRGPPAASRSGLHVAAHPVPRASGHTAAPRHVAAGSRRSEQRGSGSSKRRWLAARLAALLSGSRGRRGDVSAGSWPTGALLGLGGPAAAAAAAAAAAPASKAAAPKLPHPALRHMSRPGLPNTCHRPV